MAISNHTTRLTPEVSRRELKYYGIGSQVDRSAVLFHRGVRVVVRGLGSEDPPRALTGARCE